MARFPDVYRIACPRCGTGQLAATDPPTGSWPDQPPHTLYECFWCGASVDELNAWLAANGLPAARERDIAGIGDGHDAFLTAQLARCAGRAGEGRLHYLLGRYYLRRFDGQARALDSFDRAWAVYERLHGPTELGWVELATDRGEAAERVGRHELAYNCYLRLYEAVAANTALDPLLADCARMLGEAASRAGDTGGARRWFEHGLELLATEPTEAARVYLASLLVNGEWRVPPVLRSRALHQWSILHARQARDPRSGLVADLRDHLFAAVRDDPGEFARVEARFGDDRVARARRRDDEGRAALQCQDFATTIACFEDVLPVWRESGTADQSYLALNYLAVALVAAQRWPRAREVYAEFRDAARARFGADAMSLVIEPSWITVLIETGAPAEAHACIGELVIACDALAGSPALQYLADGRTLWEANAVYIFEAARDACRRLGDEAAAQRIDARLQPLLANRGA